MSIPWFAKWSLVAVLAACVSACSGGDQPIAGPSLPHVPSNDAQVPGDAEEAACSPHAASLERDVFAGACNALGCHRGGTTAAAALDLTGDPATLIGRSAGTCEGFQLVVPGDPDASLLVRKLEGRVPPDCGDPMPPVGSLSAEAVACVRTWVASLSPDAGPPEPDCETCGGASCVDVMRDAQHCGGCSVSCGSGECQNGSCVCRAGYEACPSGCVDLGSDANNCGACGKHCAVGELCTASGCEAASACELSVCAGACVDTDTSNQHCGGCGNACPAGSTCEQGRCSCSDQSVDFSADVAPVLVANCTNGGCHSGVRPKEGLDLSASKAYAELVGVKAAQCKDGRLLVDPGSPESSYLLQKMLGVNMCSGGQMPKAGVSIPASDLAAIRAWICQGAHQ